VSPPHIRPLLLAASICLVLAACDQSGKPSVKLPIKTPGAEPAGLDKVKLESAIDQGFGGSGTCVVIADTATGAEVYRYNSHTACGRLLPPCSTFKVPNSLIALDAGIATPTTVFKWDGSPQPVKAWEQDADMKTAFKESIVWWYQRVAQKAGVPLYQERLKAFGYGNKAPEGPLTNFWLGPAAGGRLGISTDDQAGFLHRLYTGKLPVKPESLAYVEQIMVDEIRDGYTMSGKTGTCPTNAENTRSVGWWIGRLKGPKNDWVFAASVDSETGNALPGAEVKERVKTAFTKAGLWPATA
jgi:beta-lactamase class D